MNAVEALQNLGLGVSANAVWSFLTQLQGKPRAVAETQLQSFLTVHGSNIQAATVINALAQAGLLSITQSTLTAPGNIQIAAGQGAAFHFGEGSWAQNRTGAGVVAGRGAGIVGSNGGGVLIGDDGSVTLFTGTPPTRR